MQKTENLKDRQAHSQMLHYLLFHSSRLLVANSQLFAHLLNVLSRRLGSQRFMRDCVYLRDLCPDEQNQHRVVRNTECLAPNLL